MSDWRLGMKGFMGFRVLGFEGLGLIRAFESERL